jgi:hypothetical protein
LSTLQLINDTLLVFSSTSQGVGIVIIDTVNVPIVRIINQNFSLASATKNNIYFLCNTFSVCALSLKSDISLSVTPSIIFTKDSSSNEYQGGPIGFAHSIRQ